MRAQRLQLIVVLALVFAFPLAARAGGQLFYVGFASRIMLYALAATSLNLVLGYAGMVSFGHAAFLGAGAYTVGILMTQGVSNAWLAWPAAMAVCALLATAIGAMCLRTRGAYFIMITLAFAQMIYFLAVSIGPFGGEDGFNLPRRSSIGFGLDLRDEVTFYYVAAVILVGALFLLHRLAGALIANQNDFVSPSLMQWTQSGMLMVMVILGGAGRPLGGVLGAVVCLVLEEVLSGYTIHWQFGLGAVLLAVVLFARKGLAGLLPGAVAGPRG